LSRSASTSISIHTSLLTTIPPRSRTEFQRGISHDLAREYLTRHIVCGLNEAEYRGLDLFLEYARAAREAASV
jgi:predicted solute-binding protein